MRCLTGLFCAGVLASILVSGGPAHASRCSDAHSAARTAISAAEAAQSEARRLIRERAPAARRLDIIDTEIAQRMTAGTAFQQAMEFCSFAAKASDQRALDLQARINRNTKRLKEARCQRLGFQARSLVDVAATYHKSAPDQRQAIREEFYRGHNKLKDGLASACPDSRKHLDMQLAKIEHYALTLRPNATDTSNPDARHDEAFRKALRHYRKENYRAAADGFQSAAEDGHARAQYYLGRLHMEGWGVRKSDDLALSWFKKSAEQGDPAGQNSLGLMYDLGRGVAEDDAKAVKWYARAANQGLPFAQTNLGEMYEQGQGVRRDLDAAVKLYRTAADHGHLRAHYRLGRAYERGLGVKKDLVTAITFYRRAADKGYKPAQQALAALGG